MEARNLSHIRTEDVGRLRWRSVDAGWLVRFPVAFALILLVKWGTLLDPPFWDTAMGLFPPAITLAANGFDLLGLLAMPGYLEGGPNVHSTSPVTLATAVVIGLAGGGPRMLIALHLLHFAVAAWALTTLFRLARPIFGDVATSLFCLSVLLHPTFSAQVGSLYMEVVLFLCAASAIHAWTRGKFWPAVLWGTLGYATKETGIVVPAMLALVTLLERRGWQDQAKRVAWILGLPAMWTVGIAVLRRVASGPSGQFGLLPPHDSVLGVGHSLERFLLNVPDVAAYIGVFVVAGTVLTPALLRALREEPTAPTSRDPEHLDLLVVGATGLVIVLFLLLFLVALPVVAGFTLLLPRYYVLVLPFLLLWLGYVVKRLVGGRGPRAPAVLFATLSVVFALNTNGALYPLDIDTLGPGNDPALTERSNAYERLLALEREAIEELQALPFAAPVYYGHFEHYLFRYPTLGYARGPLPNGHNLAAESLPSLIESLPPCLYALFNYPWLGGEKILELLRFAETRPDLSAEIVREMRDERYVILLIRFQAAGAACPA